jgi:hypothetical protein
MPLWETSSEEILPMAMLRRQQVQVEVRPPTSLELAYDLLSQPQPLFASRWASPAQAVVVQGSGGPEVWVPIRPAA